MVPIGGGLISGIATAAKSIRSQTKIIGVQAKACPSAVQACIEEKRVLADSKKSIADGIAVKQVGEINYIIIQEKVDDIVLVEEDEIAAAILTLLDRKKILAEGAGAVPLAALLSGRIEPSKGSKVVLS